MATTGSTRRQVLADLARSRRAEGSARRTFRIAAVTVTVLGMMGLLGLWLSGRWSGPPELLALRKSVDDQIGQVMEAARSGAAYSPDAGSTGAVFELIRQVPEAYRGQAREEIGRLFEARQTAEVESYFALRPDQRAAELDRRIRAEEQRRKAWEAERSQRAGNAGDRPGGAAQAGTGSRTSSPPQAGAGGPSPGGRRRDASEESRNARRKQALDKTSAESRARRTEYRRAKDQRRIELGLASGR
jgi:hypothetical protein